MTNEFEEVPDFYFFVLLSANSFVIVLQKILQFCYSNTVTVSTLHCL